MPVRLFAAILVLTISSIANAQFGGGGFGSGSGLGDGSFGFDLRESPSPYVETDHLLIAISESGKTVTAFSTVTGKTASLKFEEAVKPFVPVVSSNLACFTHNKTAYAFGATTGKWIQVEVEEAPVFAVSAKRITFRIKSKIYLCSAASKEWQLIDLKDDAK